MKFTRKKRPYRAVCVQLQPDNFQQVIDVLKVHGCDATPYVGQIMLRWEESAGTKYSIEMMYVGDWIRIGENGHSKIMSDEELNLKYVRI